ncbi:MAG TPA: hypothetical protein VIK84_05710 [Haloplasmataceae bacterium]
MTQTEAQILILNDVISHYNINNRSVSENNSRNCLYNGPDGKHCAAARWMIDPSQAREYGSIIEEENFKLLKPEAKLAGERFMKAIQQLHDEVECWDEKGLTFIGITEVIYYCNYFGIPEDKINLLKELK